MKNLLTTQFCGLELSSPIIAGSSSLTNNVKHISEIEKAGAGAIILKSLFEEEIYHEHKSLANDNSLSATDHENLDYLDYFIKHHNTDKYLELLRQAKQTVCIPVFASINCTNKREWLSYVNKFEEAGADGIEINLYKSVSSNKSGAEIEAEQLELIRDIVKMASSPIIVKISSHHANILGFVKELDNIGVSAITMFNRFYMPDIDINTEDIVSGDVFSHADEYQIPLRWIGLSSSHLRCDISASTGVHVSSSAIKMLLAGAATVQLSSVLYKKGIDYISVINRNIEDWMKTKGYTSTGCFRGKLGVKKENLSLLERAQFMRYFTDK
ncbi:MAG: dihydroorotate dehydrogenase-like protein [Bacteroidales bacterium]